MRIAVTLLALLLLFSGMASGAALFRCRLDAVARWTCCCAGAGEVATPSGSSMGRGRCCDVETASMVRSAAMAHRTGFATLTLPPPAIVAGSPVLVFAVRPQRLTAVAPREESTGPPIILLKRSFLL